MLPLRVPKFGIDYSETYTMDQTLSFRPAATDIDSTRAKKSVRNEFWEESGMLNPMIKRNKLVQTQEHRLLAVGENVTDTLWYERQAFTGFTMMHPVKNYLGFFSKDVNVQVPADLVYFKNLVNTKNIEEIHWSNSNGYAYDTDIFKAVAKGISEVYENDQKMKWWFGNKSIIRILDVQLHRDIMLSPTVEGVDSFLINDPKKDGSYVCMTIIRTKRFPKVSVGFAANYILRRALDHSVLEAIQYHRGTNWYVLQGINEDRYLKKNGDILRKIANSCIGGKRMTEFSPEADTTLLPSRYEFFTIIRKIGNGTVVKVVCLELQPLVSNVYVPFISSDFATAENIDLRNRYQGTPFE